MTTDTQTTTTRRAVLRRGGAVAAAVPIAGATAGTTSAQTETDDPDGILGDGFEGGDFWAFIGGMQSRLSPAFRSPETTETLADRMRNEFNANADLWVDYGNWLLDEQDVTPIGTATVAVDVTITRTRSAFSPGTTATAIDVTFDDEADEFTDLRWRLDEPDDPDYQFEVRNHAAENAADELAEFRREFISDDGDHAVPDAEYVSRLAGQYGSSLTFGEESTHVLELLLGEFDQ